MRRQAQPSKALSPKMLLAAVAFATFFVNGANAQLENNAAPQAAVTSTAKPARKVLISIPDRKLAVIESGAVVKVYDIAVGKRATPTPSGEFTIINRITHPTWYGHESGKPVPPGPENPLGTRWMGLSKKGYGIHGTNAPQSIGKRASHGCIRMAQADLEELFEMLRVGDVVVLEAQRTAEVAAVFSVPQAPAAKPVAAPVMVAAAMMP